MRVLSNVEVVEVSGGGWVDDLLEAIGSIFGSSSTSSSLTCTTATQTVGSTSSQTVSCSNGVTTVTTISNGYTSTTVISPGTTSSGEVGFRQIGGNYTYTAPANVTTTTVMNGSTTVTR